MVSARVMIVDEDAAWRETALEALARSGFDPTATSDLDEAGPRVRGQDLVVVDLELGESRVLSFARRSSVPVALVATHPTVSSALAAIELGLVGYFRKPIAEQALAQACRKAIERGRVPKQLAAAREEAEALKITVDRLVPVRDNLPADAHRLHEGWSGLTERQREIIDHLRCGMSTAQIAKRFRLSPHTVRNHLKAAYKKFSVAGRGELMQALLTRSGQQPPIPPSPPRRFRRRAREDQPDA